MRMGYGHNQVLALFRNPHYLGPHMALEKRGEPFIRTLIAEVFARWGKVVSWPALPRSKGDEAQTSADATAPVASSAATERTEPLTDPMGAPIPNLKV
jgi:hypothetical protein